MLAREKAPAVLLIRTALLLGLLVFGAATWYWRRQGTLETLPRETTDLLSYIFMALAATSLAALVFLRTRLATEKDADRQMALYIAGYASAEGAALFGGLIWFLGGVYEWYIVGLVLMVVAFQVLPIPRRAS